MPPVAGPLDEVRDVTDAVGTGQMGQAGRFNLLTDGVSAPGALAGGASTAAVTPLFADLARAVDETGDVIGSGTGATGPGSGIVGSGGLVQPIIDDANGAVLDADGAGSGFAGGVPVAGDLLQTGTGTGQGLGFGQVGQTGPDGDANLLTDIVNMPGGLMAGQGVGAVTPVLDEFGQAGEGSDGLVGTGDGDVLGSAGDVLGDDGSAAPVETGDLVTDTLAVSGGLAHGQGTAAVTPVVNASSGKR